MAADQNSSDFLERIQKLSPKRLMLLAAELERRLAAKETVAEPIAVIGMACRTPGGASTPDDLWTILANDVDAIEVVPADRWDVDSFYDEQLDVQGKANTKWGGFVRDIDQFDAAFFGIAPREAATIDPQQRMLLETAWEALEDACVRADLLAESATGVFAGISTSDYAELAEQSEESLGNAYAGTGLARSVAAGRVSYFLGLKGPNLTVDTSCSSSAVAIHLACQSLRNKECRVALAGGVNAILSPRITIMLAQAHMMAPDGRCKTFSQSADGFVRSEGCGMVVLKRLSDARADGDRIVGVIRGSAINHDGRSNGLAAPNGPSQEAVIRAALAQAELRPHDVDYIETHGTGTVLGDAIELGALGNVFADQRDAGRELQIGSIKANIGHLEAAAGVAGLIKVLLAFKNKRLPAHLHVQAGKENEALHHLPFRMPDGNRDWMAPDRPRRAGLSSFGFSGTNAHIVLEEAPALPNLPSDVRDAEVLTVSAKDPKALAALCKRYTEYLDSNKQVALSDFAFSLNAGRSHFQHRVSFTARTVAEASTTLRKLSAGNLEGEPAYRFVTGYEQPTIAFLFTGQGSQFPAMGKQLYAGSEVFREAIDKCDRILSGSLQHSLADVLCGNPSVPAELIHETSWTQPVLFAFEYALAQVWSSWGVRPSAALGHSLGEYVAAAIAGIMPLEVALTLARERGRLMGSLPRQGGMIAARIGAIEASDLLLDFPRVSIAAINGPRSAVLSGGTAQLAELRTRLESKGVVSQQLTVSHAFHSELMDPILDSFEQFCADKEFSAPHLAFISNVTGAVLSSESVIDGKYWRRHLRGTVRFAEGVSALAALKPAALIEIGPDPILLGMAKPSIDSSIAAVPSARRGVDAWQSLHQALVPLYLCGVNLDWDQVYRDRSCRKLALPTYPFQRHRFWLSGSIKPLASRAAQATQNAPAASDPQLYVVDYEALPEIVESTLLNPELLIGAADASMQAASGERAMIALSREYSELVPQIDRLCTLHIIEMLRTMGVEVVRHARLQTPPQIGARHQRLFGWFLRILEQDGVIRRDSDGFVFDNIPSTRPMIEESRLSAAYPEFAAEFALVHQASQLANVVEGRISGVEVLFPQGSFDLAERIYRDSPAAQVLNRTLGALVGDVVKGLAHSSNIRILEVGGGTGSATDQILPALPSEGVEYIFTDVSAAFFGPAQKKFARYPFVKYAALDLEKEAGGRDFTDGFDIVVASNVLHATADLRQTLRALRKMMRPGGFLVALEGTAAYRSIIVTLGMIDWWRFTDAPLRQDYPLLGRDQWLQLLTEEGFAAAATNADGVLGILSQRQIILTARKIEPIADTDTPTEVILLSENDSDSPLAPLLAQFGIETHRLLLDGRTDEGRSGSSDALAARLQTVLDQSPRVRLVLLELTPKPNDQHVPERTLAEASIVLKVLQSFISQRSPICPLWLITRGALSPHSKESLNLSSSVIDAIVKTAAMEQPALQIKHVDLAFEPAPGDVEALARLIRNGTRERTLAIRGQRIVAPRLKVLRNEAERGSVPVHGQATGAAYLITGGFGVLGMHTAEWLAERGADCLFLAGRSQPQAAVRAQIEKLRMRGVDVHEQFIDVSRRDDVSKLFAAIADSGRLLRGIFHAAGNVENGNLTQQSPETFRRVFGSKVNGAWLLHEASKEMALDFFVLFGSGASLLGLQGSANYAAANGFLDGLARLRRQQGLPATSIAWGQWTTVGLSGFVAGAERSARFGMLAFSPRQGLEMLAQCMQTNRADVAALAADWSLYLAPGNPQAEWPFFERVNQQASAQQRPEATARPNLKTLLDGAPADERVTAIRDYVRERTARVLGLDTGYSLRDDQQFSELGLDSLMALELRNDLQQSAGVTLPGNFFFEYGSIEQSATYLDKSMIEGSRTREVETSSPEYEEVEL